MAKIDVTFAASGLPVRTKPTNPLIDRNGIPCVGRRFRRCHHQRVAVPVNLRALLEICVTQSCLLFLLGLVTAGVRHSPPNAQE